MQRSRLNAAWQVWIFITLMNRPSKRIIDESHQTYTTSDPRLTGLNLEIQLLNKLVRQAYEYDHILVSNEVLKDVVVLTEVEHDELVLTLTLTLTLTPNP